MKQATSPCGRSDWDCSLCLVRPTRGRQTTIVLSPSVVRGFAPPTDGYDASDLLRGPIYRSGRRGSELSELIGSNRSDQRYRSGAELPEGIRAIGVIGGGWGRRPFAVVLDSLGKGFVS